MVKAPRCEKEGLKKGPWTLEEDQKLLAYVEEHGHGSWRSLPAKAGLQRCGKSCRLRWTNYLRPDIKRGKFTLQEEQTIIQLHALLGNRWSAIASHLPRRTDNEIKNYWNTHLKKRLEKMGIDPVTHKPKTNIFGIGRGDHQARWDAATLSHVAQWESARLEAEARLVRESKTNSNSLQNQASANSANQFMINKQVARPARPPCLDVLKAWQGVVFNMFSVKSNSLKSPTSTLNFPEMSPRTTLIPAAASTTTTTTTAIQENSNQEANDNNTSIAGSRNIIGDVAAEMNEENKAWESFEKLLNHQIMNEDGKPESSSVTVGLHGSMNRSDIATAAFTGGTEGAWFMDPFTETNEKVSIMDELSNILVCNSNNPEINIQIESSTGQENANYGINIVNPDEENRYYWDSLRDLMDAPTPAPNLF